MSYPQESMYAPTEAPPDRRGRRAMRRARRPRPPAAVNAVTIILEILLALALVRAVVVLAIGVSHLSAKGGPVVLAIGLLSTLLYGLGFALVRQVYRGKAWAWVTLLVLLGLGVLLCGGAAAVTTGQDTVARGTLMIIAAVLLVFILLLTLPRRSRAYFRQRPVAVPNAYHPAS